MEKKTQLHWDVNLHDVEIRNNSDEAIIYSASPFTVDDRNKKGMTVEFSGEIVKNSGGCLYVNEHPIPLNSKISMELNPPVILNFTIKIPSQSSVKIDDIKIEFQEEAIPLVEECDKSADVLIVTPDYPSTHNLYLCAFAHSRVRAYVEHGLHVQVAVIGNSWYEKKYVFENVPVYCGNYAALKKLLSRRQYKVIVTHFVDVPLLEIYDGYTINERHIFICHGPETTFRHLDNVCRPYFTEPIKNEGVRPEFDIKEKYIRKYAAKDNVDWVFVSEWFMDFSEKCIQCQFKHKHVINNLIDEKRFPYYKKTAEDRKKIIVLRKFDNISVHAIDQSVFAILELSRKSFFKELDFEIYGDGIYWKELVAPLLQFKNVHIHKTFVPNSDMHKVYKEGGILLIPSRHDAHPVAMSEGAATGLVVVASSVTSVPDFMNKQTNHTLADPENFTQLAEIIERLYNNPEEFLEISERMARETRERCCAEKTVVREIELIHDKLDSFGKDHHLFNVMQEKDITLTIVVPAYNVEAYLEKCLHSLCNHRNLAQTEIIVVNDGSKDKTSMIAHRYSQMTGGIVRVIDKENGGHGSTINAGIKAARGKYFRLIDGDDWVDSENLAKLIDVLEDENSDLVLTKGCYEYAERSGLENIIEYAMLREGVHYHFDDLLYPNYGFATYGPLLTTGNYRTACLKRAGFHISEKKPYVDMEFNAFSQRYVDSVVFYDLDIYRYLIGREGQTISKGFWKRKYNDHREIIFNILKTLDSMKDYSSWKKEEYVYKHILAMMMDSQVFMYDQLCLWDELEVFLKDLNKYPKAKETGIKYITEKNHDSLFILNNYKAALKNHQQSPLIREDGSRKLEVGSGKSSKMSILLAKMGGKNNRPLMMMKKAVKAIVPYGLIRIYQKKRYHM